MDIIDALALAGTALIAAAMVGWYGWQAGVFTVGTALLALAVYGVHVPSPKKDE